MEERMNKLLPTKDELRPITNPLSTFYDCGFVKDFHSLEFQKKLQVVNDLIRQTMLFRQIPDPTTELDTLIGDSHTAARVSIEYLKDLGIGKNYKYIIYNNVEIEPNNDSPTHAGVLVDDENSETYFFDATPNVGFRVGTVEKLKHCNINFYVLDSHSQTLLLRLRKSYCDLSKTGYCTNFSDCITLLIECEEIESLYGFTLSYVKLLSRLVPNKSMYDDLLIKENKHIPSSSISKIKQLHLWQEELLDNLNQNGDKKRLLQLAQNYYSEYEKIHPEFVKRLKIGNKNFTLSQLTPRFFFDNGYNVIMIKPSAFNLGVRGTIREAFLKHGNGVLCEYFTDMTKPTELTHILPISFSHTVAEKCARAYSGTSEVILLQQPANKLATIKRTLRKSLGKNIKEKEVLWLADGKKIFWSPGELNYVHSTDNPSEVGLNFLNGFPEQQVMTRFMYPNPKLEEYQRDK